MKDSMPGQASIEAAVAVSILLLTFVLVLVQVSDMNSNVAVMQGMDQQRVDCQRLSSAITLAQSSPWNSQIELQLSEDANVAGKYIRFADYYCTLNGNGFSSNLKAGNIKVTKANGVVNAGNF